MSLNIYTRVIYLNTSTCSHSNSAFHALRFAAKDKTFRKQTTSYTCILMMGTAKQKTPSPRHLTRFYIDGQYAKPISEQTYVLHNPKDDTVVADAVPIGGPEDVNAAVAAAEAAFRGPWSTFTAAQRSECLRRLADILEDRLVDILTLDSLTTGNPVSLIPSREKTYIKNNLLYYCK